jgi:hypothetical protein
MSKIPPELRKTATKAVSIERQEVGSREFGHDGRNVAESSELGKEDCSQMQCCYILSKDH